MLDISEGHLYLHAQTSVTLFRDLLRDVFSEDLRASLPDRVLPISTVAPLDPIALFTEEIAEVARLLQPGTRRRTEAAARLRALAIVDGAILGEKLQPGERELEQLGRAALEGKALEEMFPGVASVTFVTDGSGAALSLRISKKEGIPVQLVPEGTADAAVVAVKRVDELGFYNLGHKELSKAVSLTPNKTTAVIWYLKLKEDGDCFKEVTIGKSHFSRYSQHAIRRIAAAVQDGGIDQIWADYRRRLK